MYPQKLDFLGLNTFTPQPSTPDFHQRGFQAYVQHRYIIGAKGLLTSQFSHKRFRAGSKSDLHFLIVSRTTTFLTLVSARLLTERG